jgi:hypothetical protein
MLVAPRSLVCKVEKHTSSKPQVRRKQSGTPCAMVLRLIPRSPRRTGLCSHRRQPIIISELDPSVGGSGPRQSRSSGAANTSIASLPTFPDDREAPLVRAGRAKRSH